MALNQKDAVRILNAFALERVEQLPADDQIKIWLALSITLPTQTARDRARDLAAAASRLAALQLELKLAI